MDIYSEIDRSRFDLNAIQKFSPSQNLPDQMSGVWSSLVMHTAEIIISMVKTDSQPTSNYIYTFNQLSSGNYPFSNDTFRTVCTEIGCVYWDALMSNNNNQHNQNLLHEVITKLMGLYSVAIISTDNGLQSRTDPRHRNTVQSAANEYANMVKAATDRVIGGNGNWGGNNNGGGWGGSNNNNNSGGWGNDSWGGNNSNSNSGGWGGQQETSGWNGDSGNNNNDWGGNGGSGGGKGWADVSNNNDTQDWGSGFDNSNGDKAKYNALTEGFKDEDNSVVSADLSAQELQDAIDLGLIADPNATSGETKEEEKVENNHPSFEGTTDDSNCWGDLLAEGLDDTSIEADTFEDALDQLEVSWDKAAEDEELDFGEYEEVEEEDDGGISLQELMAEHVVTNYNKSIDLPENFLVDEHNRYYQMIDHGLPTTDLITLNTDTGPIIAIRESDAPLTLSIKTNSGLIGKHVGRNITPGKVACLIIDSNFVGHETMLDLETHDIYCIKPKELEALGDLCNGSKGVIGDRASDELKIANVLEIGAVHNVSSFVSDIESYLNHTIAESGVDKLLDETFGFHGTFVETVVNTSAGDLSISHGTTSALSTEVANLDETHPRLARAIENVVVRRYNRLISSMYPTESLTIDSVAALEVLETQLFNGDWENLSKSEVNTISSLMNLICSDVLSIKVGDTKGSTDIVRKTVTIGREFVIIYGGNLKDLTFMSAQKGGVQTYRVAVDALPKSLKDFLSDNAGALVSFYLGEDRIMNIIPVNNEWLQFVITETI